MKSNFIFLLMLFAISCTREISNCKIVVKNNSSIRIDSVNVLSIAGILRYKEIDPNTSVEKLVSAKPFQTSRTDGDFYFTVFVGDSIVSKSSVGYYSNGNVASEYVVIIDENFQIRQDAKGL